MACTVCCKGPEAGDKKTRPGLKAGAHVTDMQDALAGCGGKEKCRARSFYEPHTTPKQAKQAQARIQAFRGWLIGFSLGKP